METTSIYEYFTSIGGFTIKIDNLINDMCDYDALIMIGGNSWGEEDETLKRFIENAFVSNKFIAAICGAVDYLGKHEFLNTYQHAGNSLETLEQFSEYNSKFYFVSRQAIKDQNLVTANRTAALEFAELILKRFEFV